MKEGVKKEKKLVMAMEAGDPPKEQGLFTEEAHWSGDDEDAPGELFGTSNTVNTASLRPTTGCQPYTRAPTEGT